jgi:hypothetical protein
MDDDDLTLSPEERSLWLNIEAAVLESGSHSDRVLTWARGCRWRSACRYRLASAWFSLVLGAAVTVGTFSRCLLIAVIGLAIQGAAVYNLFRPVSRGLALILGQTGRALTWLNVGEPPF